MSTAPAPSAAPVDLDIQAAFIVGPVLIGTCISLVLFGVVSGQTVKFLGNSQGEPLRLRIYVSFVGGLVALETILDFVRLWRQTITYFGAIELPVLISVPLDLLLIPFISLLVEAYYIHRLSVLSKRNFFVLVPVCALLMSAFAAHLAAVVEERMYNAQRAHTIISLYEVILPLYLVGDLLLTISTATYLFYFRRNVLPENATIVNQLIRLVFQTSAPATCCIILNFAVFLNFPTVHGVHARQWAGLSVNMLIPKLFAVSVLWTINARRDTQERRKIQTGDTIRGEAVSAGGGWGSGKVYASRMSRAEGMEGAIERIKFSTEVNRDSGLWRASAPTQLPSHEPSHISSQEIVDRAAATATPGSADSAVSEMCFADPKNVECAGKMARKQSDSDGEAGDAEIEGEAGVSLGSPGSAKEWR
uniref:DUF6534 domain-containing protein n=1 Tax=Mycena chlorophos TaxID=658473 RepID=A0ABQ0LDA2_MYCCL|nr:predicted protein [Mycena chlorophos]